RLKRNGTCHVIHPRYTARGIIFVVTLSHGRQLKREHDCNKEHPSRECLIRFHRISPLLLAFRSKSSYSKMFRCEISCWRTMLKRNLNHCSDEKKGPYEKSGICRNSKVISDQ